MTIAEEDGELLGYCVLRLRDGGATVADMLVLPGRLDVVRVLIEEATEHAQVAGAASLVCALPQHHPYMEVLHRSGFVPSSVDRTRAYKPWEMTSELSFLGSDKRSRIHFMPGDGDMV